MEIRATAEGWEFEEMDEFVVHLLRGLPEFAAADDDAARRRIFPAPTAGTDTEADGDWREYVEPDLRALFKTHVDVVAADLATIRQQDETATLSVPTKNAHAWIHTLNQARLALGARHEVTEEDTAGSRRHSGPKGFAIMQIDFYGMILSLLLANTEL